MLMYKVCKIENNKVITNFLAVLTAHGGFMGKNKSTKSDGAEDFANTQDLGDQKRIPRGARNSNNPTTQKK